MKSNEHDFLTWLVLPETEELKIFTAHGFFHSFSPLGFSQFQDLTAIHRVHPEVGHSFSIINKNNSTDQYIVVSKGTVLGVAPLVLSGCSYLAPPEEKSPGIGYLTDALHNHQPVTGNLTHLLKAPINRIRGLTSILAQEMHIEPEQQQLFDYLRDSASRLSTVFDQVLGNQDADLHVSLTNLKEILEHVHEVFVEMFGQRPFHLAEADNHVHFDRKTASMLYEVTLRILSFNAHALVVPTIEWKKAEGGGFLHITYPAPENSVELYQLAGTDGLPAAAQFVRGSLLIHEMKEDAMIYKIFAPI